MKKFAAFVLAAVMIPAACFNVFALTDTKIFTDTVENTYVGRSEGKDTISNLNFNDVASDHWARESIVRSGAFDMVKGYENKFSPNSTVSNQEAIAFVLRVMGLENEAQTEAVRLKDTVPQIASVLPAWSVGYLSLARDNGLITNGEYFNATALDQSVLDPATDFIKGAPASRERVAQWIVQGLNIMSPDLLTPVGSQQKMYQYSDWDMVDVEYAQAVELLTANGIMNGLSDGRFNPKGSITRAEMAKVLSNLDSVYFRASGLEKKTGTVGGIQDAQLTQTATADLWRNVYVRNGDGKIDVLQYQLESSSSPQAGTRDAVVYKNSQVVGLSSLLEGDEIEYIVRNDAETGEKTVLYVKVTGGLARKDVQGKLMEVDYANGQIHILDNLGKRFIYSIVDGLYGTQDGSNYIVMGEKRFMDKDLPYGSSVKISLVNNIADDIQYIGDMRLTNEIRGIVVENNTAFGYLTIIDNNGNEVTKNYYSDQIMVEKQQYYDADDEIGYIDQVFPNHKYDPRDTVISDIEAGDIVFIRPSASDPDAIESISASTNYTMKYGKINSFVHDGTGMSQLLIQYEDGQTSWFDVADSVFVSKAGKPLDKSDVKAGDWVKILVNQAIISPGYVMESVKEMTVEGSGHEISTIIKGQLGAINNVQNQLSVQNSYTLTKNGWSDYREIRNVSIANGDITYYYEGNQVSLDYAMRYLKHADSDVYIALENNYSGEKAAMVSFRTSRDDVLDSDTIVNSDGTGSFNIMSRDGNITTDNGTIVRRYGRLVSGQNIMVPDYASVVLNGNNKAAVVDIYDQPDVSGVLIGRGRILSVDEGKSFSLKSTGILNGWKWVYTPVERSFQIDHNTMYIDETGISSMDNFIEYTTNSAVTKVYNIVANGTKATHVINSPYAKDAVRGEVVSAADGSIVIKRASYYKDKASSWDDVSYEDSSVNVTVPPNSIIVKNNAAVGVSALEKGDQIRVMTDSLPDRVTGGMNVTGYIILVEG